MKTNFVNDGPPPTANAYHQTREEPDYVLRARAARHMLREMQDDGAAMTTKTKKKIEKVLNTELLDAMDEARDAYMEGMQQVGKTT